MSTATEVLETNAPAEVTEASASFTVRLPVDLIRRLDEFAVRYVAATPGVLFSRGAAARLLLEHALKVYGHNRQLYAAGLKHLMLGHSPDEEG